MTKTLSASLALAAILLLATTATAQVVVPPPDLFEGEEYRIIFTTSARRDATSTDIEDYNDFVTSVANSSPELAALDVDWLAIVSTAEVDAIENTATDPLVNPGVPIYRVDGVRFTDDYTRLWGFEFSRKVPPYISERGERVTDSGDGSVWTGTSFTGTSGADGAFMGGRVVLVGDAHDSGTDMYAFTALLNTTELHLYAISDVLVAVPEPSAKSLFLCALLALGSVRSVRECRA